MSIITTIENQLPGSSGNDYFAIPAELAPQTKARSVDINNLSQLISGAFDKLPSELALKRGTVNYAADTGAVNAIAVSVNPTVITALADGMEVRVKVKFANTAAAPTLNLNGTGAVAITRADGSAIQPSDIPASIVSFSYNGTTNKWVFAPPGAQGLKGDKGDKGDSGILGAGGAALTGSQTLIATSPGALQITTTASGQSVTLPDATALSEHALLYSVQVAGPYDLWIKNSAGAYLACIHAGEVGRIGLVDNTTAAGVWAIGDGDFVGVEADGTVTTASALSSSAFVGVTATVRDAVALDANRTLLLLGGTGGVYAVAHDQATNTFGSPVLIRTGNFSNNNQHQAHAIMTATANTALVILSGPGAGTDAKAYAVSVTGTSITVGAEASGFPGVSPNVVCAPILVGSAVIVLATAGSAEYKIAAVTVAGTTASWGATISAATLTIGTDPTNNGALFALSANTFLALAIGGGAGAWPCQVGAFSVAGNTITAGTGATSTPSTDNNGRFLAKQLSTGRVVLFAFNSNSVQAYLISVAGTAVTVSAALSLAIGASQSTGWSVIANGAQVIVAAYDSGITGIYVTVVTDNAGTLVKGSTITYWPYGSNVTTLHPRPLGMFGSEAWFELLPYDSNLNAHLLKIGVSGNNPTLAGVVNTAMPIAATGIPYPVMQSMLETSTSTASLLTSATKAFMAGAVNGHAVDASGVYKHSRLVSLYAATWATMGGARNNEAWACTAYTGSLTVKLQKIRMA